jgi:hypothetical protein
MTTKDGRPMLLLGIEAENVKRLKEGQPIHVNGREDDLPIDVVIMYGETLQDVLDDLVKAGVQLPSMKQDA